MVETAHLLSDVVGGAALGAAVTLAAALVLDRAAIRGGFRRRLLGRDLEGH